MIGRPKPGPKETQPNQSSSTQVKVETLRFETTGQQLPKWVSYASYQIETVIEFVVRESLSNRRGPLRADRFKTLLFEFFFNLLGSFGITVRPDEYPIEAIANELPHKRWKVFLP